MNIGPRFNEARSAIIQNIESLQLPSDWKVVLDVSQDTEKVRLSFYKNSGIKIRFKKHTYHLCQFWSMVREIQERSYEDLLINLQKYPFLLETEMEIGS